MGVSVQLIKTIEKGRLLLLLVCGVMALSDGLAFRGCNEIHEINILHQKVVSPSAEYGVTVCRGCQSLMQMTTSSWLQA